jgi:uncharacterized protein with GYD domain
MAMYIVLANLADQGIRNVKDTAKRAGTGKELAKKLRASLKDIFWTVGQYIVVAIVEAPYNKVITSFGLDWTKLGNLRAQTLPAFSSADMSAILGKGRIARRPHMHQTDRYII